MIVLDIMLPKLNGYQVIEQLHRSEVWTPVLMLTAKDGEYDLADAFELGADDYLTGPFSCIILVARLRALILQAVAHPVRRITPPHGAAGNPFGCRRFPRSHCRLWHRVNGPDKSAVRWPKTPMVRTHGVGR